MPVVKLNLQRLQGLVGKKINKNKIVSKLPFLGLDIEELTSDSVRVEYSPNRPDYATDFGIAASLQGLFGIKKGQIKLAIKKSNFSIKVDAAVRKVRPYVVAIVAKNGTLDDETIRQLIVLQEDLHSGIGRKRKKTSIGLHDLDKITFPLRYTTVPFDHEFVPLGSSEKMSIQKILANTEVGQQYGKLINNSTRAPIILDSNGNTISFPPIINSALTEVSSKTKNLLVEVTAIEKSAAEDTLAVVATTLQVAGFDLYSVRISGSNNTTPLLKERNVILDSLYTKKLLGLNLSPSTIVNSLKKSKLGAIAKKDKIVCTIPRYRFDIFGQMDLIEEVVLGYGIENLEPALPPTVTVGQKNYETKQLDSLRLTMVGLGFTEALNTSLTSQRIQNELTKIIDSEIISVMGSKSQEYTILRKNILPSLLENLSRNVHESYPQKLFEIGSVFANDNPIKEEIHLACVDAHKDANFTEIKSNLQSMLKIGFNLTSETKSSSNPIFSQGRTADILVDNKVIGTIGEIESSVIDNFRIRVPVVGFEINLSGLIFT